MTKEKDPWKELHSGSWRAYLHDAILLVTHMLLYLSEYYIIKEMLFPRYESSIRVYVNQFEGLSPYTLQIILVLLFVLFVFLMIELNDKIVGALLFVYKKVVK